MYLSPEVLNFVHAFGHDALLLAFVFWRMNVKLNRVKSDPDDDDEPSAFQLIDLAPDGFYFFLGNFFQVDPVSEVAGCGWGVGA